MSATKNALELFDGLVPRRQLLTDPSSPFAGLSERTLLRFEAAGMPVIRQGRKIRLYDVGKIHRWLTRQRRLRRSSR